MAWLDLHGKIVLRGSITISQYKRFQLEFEICLLILIFFPASTNTDKHFRSRLWGNVAIGRILESDMKNKIKF